MKEGVPLPFDLSPLTFNLQPWNKSFLRRFPQVDWKRAKGMRDIISHHYFETDAEVIFDVCKNHIPELAETINIMIRELSQKS